MPVDDVKFVSDVMTSFEKTSLFIKILLICIMNPFAIAKRSNTQWELCCFCQENTPEKLVSPYKKPQYHKSYAEIGGDIETFIENNLPLPLNVTKECFLGDEWKTVPET